MGIVAWIFFGLIAGVVAKLLMPGRDPGGCIITMLLGFVGGFIFEQLTGRPQVMQFDFGSLFVAIIGAVVVLLIYRLIVGRRAR